SGRDPVPTDPRQRGVLAPRRLRGPYRMSFSICQQIHYLDGGEGTWQRADRIDATFVPHGFGTTEILVARFGHHFGVEFGGDRVPQVDGTIQSGGVSLEGREHTVVEFLESPDDFLRKL